MAANILLLVSQSVEMDEVVTRNRVVGQPLAEIRTCAEHIETTVNSFLGKAAELDSGKVGLVTYHENDGEVELRSVLSEQPEDCFVEASTLSGLPHDTEVRYRKTPNPTGGLDEVEFEFPIWYTSGVGEQVSPFDALESAVALVSETDESVCIVHLHTMTSGSPVIQAQDKTLEIPQHVDVINFCLTTSELVPSVSFPILSAFPSNPEAKLVAGYSSNLSPVLVSALGEVGLPAKDDSMGAILNGRLMELAKVMKAVAGLLTAATIESEVAEEPTSSVAKSEGEGPETNPAEDPGSGEESVDSQGEDATEVEMLLEDPPDDERWRVPTDEDPAPSAEPGQNTVDLLIAFDPTGSTDDPKQFSKAKTALGLVLEKLARRDGDGKVGVFSIGDASLTVTSLEAIANPAAEVVEKYEEEMVAGGGRIMKIPHSIPWVYQPVEVPEMEPPEVDVTFGGTVDLAGVKEVVLVLTDSPAGQALLDALAGQQLPESGASVAAWLYVNDPSLKLELPAAEGLDVGHGVIQQALQQVTLDDSGLSRLVVNGRASKLC